MNILPPGTHIEQYEIASLPMKGGMGVVYFALDHGNDGRPVALKTFRPELLPNREARDRFLREGTAWIELGSHPHIVRCYKVEYIDPTAFLVLELIAKEQNMPDASLRSWLIPGRPLPLEQALLFALQIARGMQYATEKIPGFVHRDLKPENILVGADKLPGTNVNRLRVTDFGLIKTIAGGNMPATAGNEDLKPIQIQFTQGAGTPLYMAPEQWRGEPVGIFTDIYAFGCILYEMSTGSLAAKGNNINALRKLHCEGNLIPETVGLPQDVLNFTKKCLHLEPVYRYQTWEELIEELRNIYIASGGDSILAVTNKNEAANNYETIQVSLSYVEIGKAYLDISKVDVAQRYFEKTLQIARAENNEILSALVLGHLGVVFFHLNDYPKSIDLYEQALKTYEKIEDIQDAAIMHDYIGRSWASLGDLSRAVNYHEKALRIYKEIADPHGEAGVLGNLGNIHLQKGEFVQSIECYGQSLQIYQSLGYKRGESNILINLGAAYKNMGDFARAMSYIERALVNARDIGNRQGEGMALGSLGQIYKNLNEYKKAFKCFDEQLSISREINDKKSESAALNGIGLVYSAFGDTDRAIGSFILELEIAQKTGDLDAQGVALGNLGNEYLTRKDYRNAIQYFEQSLVIDRKIENEYGMAIDSFNLGRLYGLMSDFPRALALMQESALVFARLNHPQLSQVQWLIDQIQKEMRK